MMNLMMWNKSFYKIEDIAIPYEINNCQYWTGSQILSSIIPNINIKNKDGSLNFRIRDIKIDDKGKIWLYIKYL